MATDSFGFLAGTDRQLQEQALARLRKQLWSRERCEDLRAIGLMLPDAEAEVVSEAADLLLLARQAHRGGRLEVRGSRHWGSK